MARGKTTAAFCPKSLLVAWRADRFRLRKESSCEIFGNPQIAGDGNSFSINSGIGIFFKIFPLIIELFNDRFFLETDDSRLSIKDVYGYIDDENIYSRFEDILKNKK